MENTPAYFGKSCVFEVYADKNATMEKITDLAVGKRNSDRVKTQQDVLRGSKEAGARKRNDSRKLGKSITIE